MRYSLALACMALLGCGPDLPTCDPDSAVMVAFANGGPFAGRPSFAGQALMTASCGNGQFCHSANANAEARFGVPRGLDFDVTVPCTSRTSCDELAIDRLREDQLRVLEHAYAITDELRDGRMPPGGRGRAVLDATGYRLGPEAASPPLPSIDTAEGRAILENWLACGAPVVEATIPPTVDNPPGVSCGRGMGGVGECIVRTDLVLPLPTFASIFENVLEPACGRVCHGPEGVDQRMESALDLSQIDVAYDALVNAPTGGIACMDTSAAAVRVVPGDPDASLLLQKLDNPTSCGDPMPSATDLLPPSMIDVIRLWISNGAER